MQTHILDAQKKFRIKNEGGASYKTLQFQFLWDYFPISAYCLRKYQFQWITNTNTNTEDSEKYKDFTKIQYTL